MVRNLKRGYTTGSTAAGASKLAVYTLFNRKKLEDISISLPKGLEIEIETGYSVLKSDYVKTFAIKNYSDDPDITRGIKIYAEAVKSDLPGIIIEAGVGIGIVTKKGLKVPVGEPAINPEPYKMIINEIEKVLPKGEGVVVTLSIPEGAEIAKKTFNPKLGIVGGISILGTTGIVEPMSEEAFKEALKVEMNVSHYNNPGVQLFVFGNYGVDFLNRYNISKDRVLKTSNFIGFMAKSAGELGIKRVLITGHAGKMVKVAYGMDNTHSKYGDNRMQSIADNCFHNSDYIKEALLRCNTTDEAVELLERENLVKEVFDRINSRCVDNLKKWSGYRVEFESIIFTSSAGLVSKTSGAEEWLREVSNG